RFLNYNIYHIPVQHNDGYLTFSHIQMPYSTEFGAPGPAQESQLDALSACMGKRRASGPKKERRRTESINTAFTELRECIPNVPVDTKLYISHLMDVPRIVTQHGQLLTRATLKPSCTSSLSWGSVTWGSVTWGPERGEVRLVFHMSLVLCRISEREEDRREHCLHTVRGKKYLTPLQNMT
uniref:Heart- and neural crest derivatives-expressed protein 1 n=1 Tax=Oncorhynchus mykiss TaxID=8022 RepID=A0A8C7U152_ONCMY